MRKILSALLCVILLVTMVGCGTTLKEDAETEESPDPTSMLQEESFTLLNLDAAEEFEFVRYYVPSDWEKATENTSIYYFPFAGTKEQFIQVTCLDGVDAESVEEKEEWLNKFINTSEKQVYDFSSEKVSIFPGEPSYKCSFISVMNNSDYDYYGYLFIHEKKAYLFASGQPEGTTSKLEEYVNQIVENIELMERKQDFLDDKELREKINNLKNEFKFYEIVEIADKYIAENNPDDTDSAFVVKEAAQEAAKAMQNCTLVVDDFSGEGVLYGGASVISSEINFVPYFADSYDRVTVRVGFKKNGWLFFEDVSVKVADGDFVDDYFSYDEVKREVVSGSTILEEANAEFEFDEVEKILAAENPIIRFIGENDETYDHKLTKQEIDSLSNIYSISKGMTVIANKILDID